MILEGELFALTIFQTVFEIVFYTGELFTLPIFHFCFVHLSPPVFLAKCSFAKKM